MFRALKRPLKNKGGIQKKKEKADYFKKKIILPHFASEKNRDRVTTQRRHR